MKQQYWKPPGIYIPMEITCPYKWFVRPRWMLEAFITNYLHVFVHSLVGPVNQKTGVVRTVAWNQPTISCNRPAFLPTTGRAEIQRDANSTLGRQSQVADVSVEFIQSAMKCSRRILETRAR